MTTMTEQPTACTAEQKAEWSDLHDRMQKVRRDMESAESSASYSLMKHVEAGGMTPGPFGVPSPAALTDYVYACEYATEAARLRAEWEALYAEAQAHPYTAELHARREQQQA